VTTSHRRVVGHVPMGVWDTRRYVNVVASVDLSPLQPLIAHDQNLLSARQNEKVLGVAVAMQRHQDAGR